MLNTETEKYWLSKLSLEDKIAYKQSCKEHREQVLSKLGYKCSNCEAIKSASSLHVIPRADNSAFKNKRHYYKVLKKSPSIELEAYLLCKACEYAISGRRTLKAYLEAKQAREQRHASFVPKIIRKRASSNLLDDTRASEQASKQAKQA